MDFHFLIFTFIRRKLNNPLFTESDIKKVGSQWAEEW
jgi:hypothetical protein